MTACSTYEAGDIELQNGQVFRRARLAYKTYGTLAADKGNAILVLTPFGAHHTDIEHQVANGRALDPDRYFVVIANLFGNGLSSSPSNLQEGEGPWNDFTIADNVKVQERMLREVFGIEALELVHGFSMGGMQALHWAALFPRKVKRFSAVCATARVSPHNFVFLEGLRTVLTAGGDAVPAEERMRAFGRVFAGWAVSQAFYREECWRSLGFKTLDEYITGFWEANFVKRDARNLVAHIRTWQLADISANDTYRGDLDAALGSIEAKGLMMPSATDLYMHADDARSETAAMPNARFQLIPSILGHRAGNAPRGSQEEGLVEEALSKLLAS